MTVGRDTATKPVRRPRRVSVALWLALFTVTFNLYVMTNLIIPITRDLGTTLGTAQNALVLIALVTFAMVPTSQRLGSIYGYKKLFVVGLVVFGLGLTATAVSRNALMLIVGYGMITGMGATPLVTLPWLLVSRSSTGLRRELGYFYLVMAMVTGSLVGPTFGGLVNTRSSWPWAFLLQLPLVILIWYLIRPADEIVERPDDQIDWAGAILSFTGLVLIALGINLSNEYGWWQPIRTVRLGSVAIPPFALSIVPLIMALGAILLVAFAMVWRRRARGSHKIQVWQLGVLKQRQFDVSLLASAFYAVASAGFTYLLYLFLQVSGTFSLTSFDAAIAVLPYNIAMVVVLLATFLLGRWIPPKRLIQIGLVTAIVGLWILHQSFVSEATTTDLVPGLVVTGLGAGLVVGQMAPLALSAVGEEQQSEGRGIFNSVQDLSYAVGISAFGLLLIYLLSAATVDAVLGAVDFPAGDSDRTELISEVERSAQRMTTEELAAFWSELSQEDAEAMNSMLAGPENDSMQNALMGVAAVMAGGLVVAFFLPKHRLRGTTTTTHSATSTVPPSKAE